MRFTHLLKSVLHCFGLGDISFEYKRRWHQRANLEKGQERRWFHPIKSNPKKHLRIERLTLQCIGGLQWWYNLILFSERESECLDLKECWPRRQHVANVMRIFGEKHGWSVTLRARKGERSQSCGAYKKRNSDPAAELPEQVEVGQEERKLESHRAREIRGENETIQSLERSTVSWIWIKQWY